MPSKTPSPHDQFARKVFGNPETAADLFKNYTENAVAKAVDWSQIKSLPKQEFGEIFDERIFDLLFSAPLKKKGQDSFAMILTEHKSEPDPNLMLQVGTYLFLAWSRYWRNAKKPNLKNKPLPAPVIVVLYNGGKPWKPPEMQEIVTRVPGLEEYIPKFKVWMIDLAKLDLTQIKGKPSTRAALEALKRAGDKTISTNLVNVLAHLKKESLTVQIKNQVRDILVYADSVKKLVAEQVKNALDSIFPEKGGDIMAHVMLDDYKVEGKAEAVVAFLSTRFGDLPEEMVQAIAKVKGHKKVDKLVTLAAACQSIDEFAEALK